MNRAGKQFEYPTSYEYAGDLGNSVLGEYCTVPCVFKHIEERYHETGEYTKLDIANEIDILKLYFGINEDYLHQLRDWYLNYIGVTVPEEGRDKQNNQDQSPEEGTDDDLLQFAQHIM